MEVISAFLLQTSDFTLQPSQPSTDPIIVKIIEPPGSELTDLADVLLGSIGLTGAIVLLAVLLGFVMAGVMFWVRSRSA